MHDKAVGIVESVMRGEMPSEPSLNTKIDDAKVSDSSTEESRYCEVIIDRVLVWDVDAKYL